MAGLVGYDSSSSEEVEEKTPNVAAKSSATDPAKIANGNQVNVSSPPEGRSGEDPRDIASAGPKPQTAMAAESSDNAGLAGERLEIMSLTMPTEMAFELPPSPSSSPPPNNNKKLQQFLRLKEDGVHFNDRLASSAALKNPSLLTAFIESSSCHIESPSQNLQYSTTLQAETNLHQAILQMVHK